jgi:hypothetical protein
MRKFSRFAFVLFLKNGAKMGLKGYFTLEIQLSGHGALKFQA